MMTKPRVRNMVCEAGEKSFDSVGDFDGIRARLAEDRHGDRPFGAGGGVEPGESLVVFDGVEDRGDFVEADRCAADGRYDHGFKGVGVGKLAGGMDGDDLVLSIQSSGGNVDVVAADGGLHFVDADAAGG